MRELGALFAGLQAAVINAAARSIRVSRINNLNPSGGEGIIFFFCFRMGFFEVLRELRGLWVEKSIMGIDDLTGLLDI